MRLRTSRGKKLCRYAITLGARDGARLLKPTRIRSSSTSLWILHLADPPHQPKQELMHSTHWRLLEPWETIRFAWQLTELTAQVQVYHSLLAL